jgi:flagellar basal body rod protein FlgG
MHAVVIPIETNWFNFYLQPKNNNDVLHRQVDLQNNGSIEDENLESQNYNVLGNFTQLITAPNCGEENLQF